MRATSKFGWGEPLSGVIFAAAVYYGVPGNAEMLFWHAITLAGAGRVDEAKPLLGRAYGIDRNWRELVGRLPKAGLLPDDPALVRTLTEVRPAWGRSTPKH